MIVRCSIPFARIDETTPTVRATRTIPAVWPLWDAVAHVAVLQVMVTPVRVIQTTRGVWPLWDGIAMAAALERSYGRANTILRLSYERHTVERRLNDLRAEVATAWQRYQEMSVEVDNVRALAWDSAAIAQQNYETLGIVARACIESAERELDQAMAEVARLAARVAVLEAEHGA